VGRHGWWKWYGTVLEWSWGKAYYKLSYKSCGWFWISWEMCPRDFGIQLTWIISNHLPCSKEQDLFNFGGVGAKKNNTIRHR
jgi:hypothetical protein